MSALPRCLYPHLDPDGALAAMRARRKDEEQAAAGANGGERRYVATSSLLVDALAERETHPERTKR
jgi:hypothetical protein